MEDTATIGLRVGVELHHSVIGRNARLERWLARHLLEKELRGSSITDTAARHNDGAVGDGGRLDVLHLHVLEELERKVGLARLCELRNDSIVHENVGSNAEALGLGEKRHRVGRVVSGVLDVEDESTVGIRGGNAALLEDAVAVGMSTVKVASVCQSDDHVVLGKEPARRLPLLHALQRVQDDLCTIVNLVDFVNLAKTAESADETS